MEEVNDPAPLNLCEFGEDLIIVFSLKFDRADETDAFPSIDPFEEFSWVADDV